MESGRAMTGAEIMRFVKRNAYRPDLVAAHWHRVAGRLSDFAICVANPMTGFAYRVEIGEVPEHNIIHPNNSIAVRGWRSLFKQMICDGVLKNTAEVNKLIGSTEMAQLTNMNHGLELNATAHELA